MQRIVRVHETYDNGFVIACSLGTKDVMGSSAVKGFFKKQGCTVVELHPDSFVGRDRTGLRTSAAEYRVEPPLPAEEMSAMAIVIKSALGDSGRVIAGTGEAPDSNVVAEEELYRFLGVS